MNLLRFPVRAKHKSSRRPSLKSAFPVNWAGNSNSLPLCRCHSITFSVFFPVRKSTKRLERVRQHQHQVTPRRHSKPCEEKSHIPRTSEILLLPCFELC